MHRQLFSTVLSAALLVTVPAVARPQATAAPQASALARTEIQVHLLGRMHKKEREELQKAWLPAIQQQLRVNWRPLQPETTQPPMQASGATVLVADVTPQGRIDQLTVTQTSDNVALDEAARGAVQSAVPFPPLPPGLKDRNLRLQLDFIYNWSAAPTRPTR